MSPGTNVTCGLSSILSSGLRDLRRPCAVAYARTVIFKKGFRRGSSIIHRMISELALPLRVAHARSNFVVFVYYVFSFV